MSPAQQYLFEYLQDEFKDFPQVRIRKIPTLRPEDENGITVRTESREYFFEFAWVEQMRLEKVSQLVEKIKEIL